MSRIVNLCEGECNLGRRARKCVDTDMGGETPSGQEQNRVRKETAHTPGAKLTAKSEPTQRDVLLAVQRAGSKANHGRVEVRASKLLTRVPGILEWAQMESSPEHGRDANNQN